MVQRLVEEVEPKFLTSMWSWSSFGGSSHLFQNKSSPLDHVDALKIVGRGIKESPVWVLLRPARSHFYTPFSSP